MRNARPALLLSVSHGRAVALQSQASDFSSSSHSSGVSAAHLIELGVSAPSLGTEVVSLCDMWLGHGFFSQVAHPAPMCHGGLAACSGFPNPSQVELSSRVSPSPLTQAPTVGNSLTTGTESQAAFSAERFHPKPGSALQFHTLKAQSNPKAEMDATAATWVYTAMPQPFISSPRVRFCPRANAAQPPCPAF